MPLLGLTLTLALLGLWVYCLLDVIATDADAVRTMPKVAWLIVVVLFGVLGGMAWRFAGRPVDRAPELPRWPGAPTQEEEHSRRSRPSRRRARPLAPDDDPEFLRGLEQRLRGESEGPPG